MKKVILAVFFYLAMCAPSVFGEPRSGHVDWGLWSFDWGVQDKAGLVLKNVTFNHHYVIFKASLPVIRVRYEPEPDGNICGPYADRIVWGPPISIGGHPPHLVNIGGRCGGKKVCQHSFTSGGVNWLEMAVYARIGAYHLYQAWYLSSDGQIDARLLSKGLSCNADHAHHPYWRFDFDVEGAGGDQILYHQGSPSTGNFFINYYQTEQNDVKDNPSLNRRWLVRDQNTANLVWIFPGSGDGALDPYGFCTKDVGLRTYQGTEDQIWPFGASGHLGYLTPPQNIDTTDIVFWYVAHLYHQAIGGADEWHGVGPTLKVAVPTPTPTPTPSAERRECLEHCESDYDECRERPVPRGEHPPNCEAIRNRCRARCPRQ